MVPVALATLADERAPRAAARSSRRASPTTTRSPTPAAVHVGELLHLAFLGRGKPRLRRASDALVARGTRRSPSSRTRASRPATSSTPSRPCSTLLPPTRGFEECVVDVVNRGGDADTTGAIAGAIAGAYYGAGRAAARAGCGGSTAQVRAEIEALAERLVALSPLGRGEPPGPRLGRVRQQHPPHPQLAAHHEELPLAPQDRAREEVAGEEDRAGSRRAPRAPRRRTPTPAPGRR